VGGTRWGDGVYGCGHVVVCGLMEGRSPVEGRGTRGRALERVRERHS
jgi:hypothetical protein